MLKLINKLREKLTMGRRPGSKNRPKEFNLNPETQVIVENPVVNQTPEPTVLLNNVALSVLQDPVTKKWSVLEIPFDFATQTFGEIKVVETNEAFAVIRERFLVLAGRNF